MGASPISTIKHGTERATPKRTTARPCVGLLAGCWDQAAFAQRSPSFAGSVATVSAQSGVALSQMECLLFDEWAKRKLKIVVRATNQTTG
jgi:hypothetical protein